MDTEREAPPHVSVVVPTRGADAPAARAAIAAQGLADTEVVVMGGARGPAAGRNAGAARARGAVLVFCDDDVRLEPPDALRRLVAALEADAAAGAVGATVALPPDASPFQRRLAREVPRIELAAGAGPGPVCGLPTGACFVVTRDAFDAVGGFDERLPSGEDVAFFLALQRKGRATLIDPAVRVLHYPPAGWRALWRKFVWYGRGQLRLARHHAVGGHRRWAHWPPLASCYAVVRLLGAPFHALVDLRDGRPRLGWRPLRAWASAAAAVGFALEAWRRARPLIRTR